MESILDSLIHNLQQAKLALQADEIQHELNSRLHVDKDDALPDPNLLEKSSTVINLSHEISAVLESSHVLLADHIFGYAKPQSLAAAVHHRIPDILNAHGPQNLSDLSDLSNCKPLPLRQVLRFLSGSGIFHHDPATDTFANNRASYLLCEDKWGALWAQLYGGGQFYDIARGIPRSMSKHEKRTAFQVEFGTDEEVYQVFEKKGWTHQFHRALTAGSVAQAGGVLEDYPWEEVKDEEIVDVGGGSGALIALLLRKFKGMKGGVYDLPTTIHEARRAFHDENGDFRDVGDRVDSERLVGGNFFQGDFPQAKVYIMKWVMHNWGYDEGLKILRGLRDKIMNVPEARLVVLDTVLGYKHTDRLSRFADITMMMSIDRALERTRAEWETIAIDAGWHIHRIHLLRTAWPCAIDMRPI